MGSKRLLKKNINESFALLYTECVFYKTFVFDANKVEADGCLAEIVKTHNEMLDKLNEVRRKPKSDRAKLYKALRIEFINKINSLAESINKID